MICSEATLACYPKESWATAISLREGKLTLAPHLIGRSIALFYEAFELTQAIFSCRPANYLTGTPDDPVRAYRFAMPRTPRYYDFRWQRAKPIQIL